MISSGFHLSSPLVILGLGLLFAFSAGYRDSSTIVATVVSTRALTPNKAFLLCAVFEFIGALFIGTALVTTLKDKVLLDNAAPGTPHMSLVLISALAAALLWGIVGAWRVWPTSNNHALVSGLTGAGLAAWGTEYFHSEIILKMFLVLLLSPLVGFVVSIFLTRAIRYLGEWMTPKAGPIAEFIHVLACLFVSCAHGSNGGQMILGLLLLGVGVMEMETAELWGLPIHSPMFMRGSIALALALGVLMGGRRLLKKLGMSFYRIQVTQGLGSQLTAALTILMCLSKGFPASTTQVITGSILGAGAAKNPKALKWNLAVDIGLAWLITLPMVAMLAALIFTGARLLGNHL